MRIIKFRGLGVDGKGWVYGGFVKGKSGRSYIFNGNDEEYMEGDINVVIPETVGQYTGLKDKNEKEIYEGDKIVFVWFSYGEYELEEHIEGVIEFLNGSFMFCCNHGNYPFSELNFDSESDIEIIGSIHENKDLI